MLVFAAFVPFLGHAVLIFDFALGHTILMFACAGKCATIPFFDTNVEHDTNCCLLKTCGLNVTFGPAPTSSVSQCACLSVWRLCCAPCDCACGAVRARLIKLIRVCTIAHGNSSALQYPHSGHCLQYTR